jgi:methyl-accepting chemotaxis protein
MRLSIRTKLLAGFAAVLAAMLVLGVASLTGAASLHANAHTIGTSAIQKIDVLGQTETMMNKYRKDQLRYVISLSPAQKHDAGGDIAADTATMQSLIAKQEQLASGSSDAKAASAFAADWSTYLARTKPAFPLSDKGDIAHIKQAILIITTGPGDHAYDAVKAAAATLHQQSLTNAANLVGHTTATYHRVRLLTLALLAFAFVLALGVALWLARRIGAGVAQLVEAARRLADGDVEQEVALASNDELGDIAHAFRGTISYIDDAARAADRIADGDLITPIEPKSDQDKLGTALARMVANLRSMIGDVAHAAEAIGSSSSQMALTSEEAGRAVGEIANAIGDVAQGAERQVQMVDYARMSSEETGAAAEDALGRAEEGVASAAQAGEAMLALRASTEHVTDAIRGLAAKSGQIGGIVETITGIASQTNLLALNAAIEAARAGEQGRGFAVVADEVRKLAEESQTAAASIAGLISEIQVETERTVEAVEAGARRTDESSATVEAAQEAFRQIGASVEDIRGRVAVIVEATSEVAAVAQQSSASVEQVSASTEQTSASSQEIAASAQELAGTARELQQLVAQFQI